jgi:hypothetical protein
MEPSPSHGRQQLGSSICCSLLPQNCPQVQARWSSLSCRLLTTTLARTPLGQSLQQEWTGSTSDGARVDAALSCGVTSSQPALGVWHAVIGDGGRTTASTCTGTDFDSQMSVFAGGSCGQLTCFGNDADGCGRQSLVDFQSIQDQTCHVLVHGFGDASGNFALQIRRLLCPQMFFVRMPIILPRQFDGCCAQKWELPT